MHQLRNIFCIAIIIGTTACTQKRDFGGDRMTNYPDLNLIAKDYLLNYEKNPYTFLKISIEKQLLKNKKRCVSFGIVFLQVNGINKSL